MSNKKTGLGKGLSALLPQLPSDSPDEGPPSQLYDFEDRPSSGAGRISEVSVDAIQPNPYQPRTNFDEESLVELADSIKQFGVIQPLTVRSLGNGKYELITGERRLRAARISEMETVPAYVREADTEAMLEMAIVENIQREDLNPIEVALGYQRLMEEIGLTQDKVAAKVSKSRSAVTNALRLLRLPPDIQASLRDGRISAGHARALISLDDVVTQLEIHSAILRDGLSVRDVENMVRESRSSKSSKKSSSSKEKEEKSGGLSPRDRLEIEGFEAQLREHLGTKASIQYRSGEGTGSILIEYFSLEDLERLIALIAS
ncbi:MAG: ParB/RepB/Spo0J family partition protein [Rubricoccaceae bacterium]|nr:ParB/RepB/Spo0J family partition protein [Rubricoccaceae bacterium]